MRVAIGTYRFAEPGGSEGYALTVAQELARLGHEAWVVAEEHGAFSDFARETGVPVLATDDPSHSAPDALITQDGVLAHLLAERHPRVPHVFVAHSPLHDLQWPPQVDGYDAVVVLNERLRRRVAAMARRVRVVRLRQPIEMRRFAPGPALPETPRRVLLLGNRLWGEKLEAVRAACERLGLECEQRGLTATSTPRPEAALRDAHVVMGHGRAIVEAMACGRAAYVFDLAGEDGWVTDQTYDSMERDGFAGGVFAMPFDAERLVRSLDRYEPAMGPVNRDLVRRWHNAATHAVELVELLESVGAITTRAGGPHAELARLSRLQWQAETRGAGFRQEALAAGARATAAEERALVAERSLRQIQISRAYRFSRAVARLAANIRARRRSR